MGGTPAKPVPSQAAMGAPGRPPVRKPSMRRLIGICAWAAVLGFLGMLLGIRGLIAIIVKAPGWYEPALIGLGLGGIALIVVAFLTVHYRYVPWLFLTLSTATLIVALVETAKVT
jgi:hypothetical protein